MLAQMLHFNAATILMVAWRSHQTPPQNVATGDLCLKVTGYLGGLVTGEHVPKGLVVPEATCPLLPHIINSQQLLLPVTAKPK